MGSSEKCGAAAGAGLVVLGCCGLFRVVPCGAVWCGGVVPWWKIFSLLQPVIINCLPFYLPSQTADLSKQPRR